MSEFKLISKNSQLIYFVNLKALNYIREIKESNLDPQDSKTFREKRPQVKYTLGLIKPHVHAHLK